MPQRQLSHHLPATKMTNKDPEKILLFSIILIFSEISDTPEARKVFLSLSLSPLIYTEKGVLKRELSLLVNSSFRGRNTSLQANNEDNDTPVFRPVLWRWILDLV